MRLPTRLFLLSSLLLAATAAGAEPKSSRRTVSVDGTWRIQLVQEAPGRCRVEVVGEAGPLWTLERCVGGPEDAYFVSRDGRRFWVVHTLPQKAEGRPLYKGRGRHRRQVAPGWARTQVAALYDAKGTRHDTKRLLELLGEKGYGKVRELARHFTWLEGVNGVPGKPPRLNDAGEVELETVEGRTVRLSLERGRAGGGR